MPFDYLNIDLPESKKTTLNTMKIQQKMMKVMFCLTLYPDMELAGAFAGIGDIHKTLLFHYGDDVYMRMREDIQERRKSRGEQPIMNILQSLYDLWSEEYNINDLYNMITGKQTCNGEENKEMVETDILKTYREDDTTPSSYLTFANVIENIDTHIEIEKSFHNPEVASGRWWIISYDRFVLDGKMRPFILMSKLNAEGKICYIQGVWPLDYFLVALEKIVPLGYRAEHGNYIFLDVQVETIQTKARGRLQKYHLIRKVESPTEQ